MSRFPLKFSSILILSAVVSLVIFSSTVAAKDLTKPTVTNSRRNDPNYYFYPYDVNCIDKHRQL